MPRLIAFTRYGRLGASSRVRFLQFQAHLEQAGMQVHVSPLLSDRYLEILYTQKKRSWLEMVRGYFLRCVDIFRIPFYDYIWIEKELFPGLPATVERLLHLGGFRYVVDYDDAIFHNYDLASNPLYRYLMGEKIAVVMRSAGTVVAGNPYIAEYARRARSGCVKIIPSVVDTNQYGIATRPNGLLPVIGWIGSPSTAPYLLQIAPALREANQKIPFELVVIGAQIELEGLSVRCKAWSEATEIQEIQQFDIGIMPLPDDPWARGKCGYKLIQYMACGVAVIGSPVGVNREIVSAAVGFAPESSEAWQDALLSLLADAGLRLSIGIQGRLRVEMFYSMQSAASEFCELIPRPCT
jgi:glycosyltransferase involved in cell wall biosynthesis